MFIDGLTNADAMPVLRTAVSFAGQRQKLIAHNIANLSTPNFRPKDVSVGGFQEQLSDAIDRRRKAFGGHRGNLELKDSREVSANTAGGVSLTPRESGRNVLFHDRNNRDLERTMQDLAENVAAFRVASDLLKNHSNLLNSAIRERL